MKHILVLRFSALGDVAMTVPVLKNLLNQHPDIQITMLSVPFVAPLFAGIDRLHFRGIHMAHYKGPAGLYRLALEVKKTVAFDAIADLHNVLRTKLLRFFWLGKKAAVLDKGRREKKELTRPRNKKLRQLKTTFQRYADVFEQLGASVDLRIADGLQRPALQRPPLPFVAPGGEIVIGIAPFAKHAAKMYPFEKTEAVCNLLLGDKRVRLLFFTSKDELPLIADYLAAHPAANAVAEKNNFASELKIIAGLDVMISMDSANMHLASLYGVPVVSVWGGTHHYLGFYGWGQKEEDIVELALGCRPSSVFGNKDCPVHGPLGCMQGITPKMIADKVWTVLSRK